MKILAALLGAVVLAVIIGWRASPGARSSDDQAIRALYTQYSQYVKARDVSGIRSLYAPGTKLVAFDAFGPPSEDVGAQSYAQGFHFGKYFRIFGGPISEQITSLQIAVVGALAYAYGFDRWAAVPKGHNEKLTQVYRFTDVLQKIGGKWLIVHEHLSFPVSPTTGKADWLSRR
jgi:ketosteroid isomerase-like protein